MAAFIPKPTCAEADYPRVRSSSVCPLCGEYKEPGLVVCWSCYRAWDMRYGNVEAESLIAQAEAKLGEELQGT